MLDPPAAKAPVDSILQRYLDAELDRADEPDIGGQVPPAMALPLTPADIAAMGTRIALGHTKTAVVRAMPGYDTRRHRAFAAYYDRIAADLAAQGLIARGTRDAALASAAES